MPIIASIIAWLKKEGHVIKSAPASFISVCLVAVGLIYLGENRIFKSKLEDAHESTSHWISESQRWQSDVEYWKDIASHSNYSQPTSVAPATPTGAKPTKNSNATPLKNPSTSVPPKPSKSTSQTPAIPQTQVNAPNGVAIGGDNNGSATVNNYGPSQRTLTAEQSGILEAKIGPSPSEGFDGVYCILGDTEGHQYAQQFWDVFKQQGWTVGLMVGQSMMDRSVPGLFVAISPEDATSPPDGVMRVYAALRSAGLPVQGMKMNGLQKGHWYVLVGNQPA